MRKGFAEYIDSINKGYCAEVPSMLDTHHFIDDLIFLLFPIKQNRYINKIEIEIRLERLELRLKELLIPMGKELQKDPSDISRDFFNELPDIFRSLLSDAETFLKGDPAARCTEEIILAYPGFYALSIYRISHQLYLQEVPVIPRVMSEYAHSKTGIDIHPGAYIGKNMLIDHGTGVVIGETSIIGNNVKIYQGVTLGAMYVERKLKETKRHPTIEDNVIIYAGSTILGGNTVVGHDTVIGGNVWLTESVMPHSVVYRQHKVVRRDSKDFNEPINFVI